MKYCIVMNDTFYDKTTGRFMKEFDGSKCYFDSFIDASIDLNNIVIGFGDELDIVPSTELSCSRIMTPREDKITEDITGDYSMMLYKTGRLSDDDIEAKLLECDHIGDNLTTFVRLCNEPRPDESLEAIAERLISNDVSGDYVTEFALATDYKDKDRLLESVLQNDRDGFNLMKFVAMTDDVNRDLLETHIDDVKDNGFRAMIKDSLSNENWKEDVTNKFKEMTLINDISEEGWGYDE